LYQKK